jgi:hypothetical protein
MTINQYLDKLTEKYTLDEIKGDPDLHRLCATLIEMKLVYGGRQTINIEKIKKYV